MCGPASTKLLEGRVVQCEAAAHAPARTRPPDRVLILDFGSQVTQLIARRLRESGVYCEILPFNADPGAFATSTPRGIILSGGPACVHEADSPRAPEVVFELGVPVLGICYGQQTMCAQLGGEVRGGPTTASSAAPSSRCEEPARCSTASGRWARASRCG